MEGNCLFLIAILGFDPAQKLAKYERWLCVTCHTGDSWMIYENKTKDVQGQGPFQHNP